jgi:hypothetical protein
MNAITKKGAVKTEDTDVMRLQPPLNLKTSPQSACGEDAYLAPRIGRGGAARKSLEAPTLAH